MEKKEIKTNENIFKLIKNGLNELWYKKWKFIFLAIYEVIAFLLWTISCALWELFGFDKLPELIYKVTKISYFVTIATTLLLLLFQIIILIGQFANKKMKNRCDTGFKRCGLKTDTNEFPQLLNVYNDDFVKHCLVYEFDNLQIPLQEWDNKTANLQKILKGKVNRFEEEDNADITRVVILPNRYVSPYYIDINDNALSSMDNCLIVGPTGSGKSYCSLSILCKVAKYNKNVSITIADYKNSFKQFHGLLNFYGYEDAIKGIEKFDEELKRRIADNGNQAEPYPIRYLFVDELSSLVKSRKTKAEQDHILTMISNILRLGRELNMRIIVGVQKAQMSYFDSERENFKNIIALGRLSKEQKNMLFDDQKDKITINSFKRGERLYFSLWRRYTEM